ncbi:MAG: hypothetical protein Q8Q39_01315 [bacterium]|nr:hypothetical protein [bacterium]
MTAEKKRVIKRVGRGLFWTGATISGGILAFIAVKGVLKIMERDLKASDADTCRRSSGNCDDDSQLFIGS